MWFSQFWIIHIWLHHIWLHHIWFHHNWIFPLWWLRRRWQRLRLFQDGVFQIGKPPLSIPKPTTFYIPRLFQLLNGSANTVYTILADAGKPLCGIIPIFWQGQHERKQTFCFQGKLPVTQMMVCHDGVISGFVYTKYCDSSSPLFAGGIRRGRISPCP